MNFKVFAAFFVTLLAVHASTQTPLAASIDKAQIATLFEAVLRVTAEALNLTNTIVKDLEADKEAIIGEIVSLAVSLANKTNHEIVLAIDKFKDGATPEGKAVISCIEGEEPKTDAALEKFAKAAGSCIGNEVKLVFKEVDTILSQLGDLQNEVKSEVDELRDCKSDDAICVLQFGQKALGTIKKILPVVKKDISDIVKLAKTIVSDISACKLLQVIKSSAQEIFNDAVVCIKK